MGNKPVKHPYKFSEPKDLIGKGAFGKTVKAQKTSGKKNNVAIHVLTKEARFTDPSLVVHAAASIIRLANFSKNVLRCIDFYDDKMGYYVVTEWCSHGDLGRYLQAVKPFMITKIDLIQQSVDGLSYLHSQTPAVLHAHLKPANVLVHSEDFQDIVKISDYGFQVLLPTCDIFSKFLLSKEAGLFCPPEYFLPAGKFSTAVDVFSIGLIMYTILRHSGEAADISPKTDRHERFSIDFTTFPLGKLMTRDISQSEVSYQVVSAKPDESHHVREIIGVINDMLRPNPEERTPLQIVQSHLQAISEELSIRPRDSMDNFSLRSAPPGMISPLQSPSHSQLARSQSDLYHSFTPAAFQVRPQLDQPKIAPKREPIYAEVAEDSEDVGAAAGSIKYSRVKATHPYTPQHGDELALKVGDVITVLEKDPSGWWTGEINGQKGLFPENFVEALPLPIPPVRKSKPPVLQTSSF